VPIGYTENINNVDDVIVLLTSRSRQCEQQRSAVGHVIHFVLRPSNGGFVKHCHAFEILRSDTATRDTSGSQVCPSAFSSLFCYSGWSQIVRVI